MEPLDVASVVLRAAAFITALQAAGVAWFVAVCGRAGLGAVPSVTRLLRISALCAVPLVLMHRGLDAGRLTGEWSGMLDLHLQRMVWGRRPGLSSMVCAAGILGVVAGTSKSGRWGVRLGFVGALCVVGSFALTGHTTEASHPFLLQGLLALHVGLAAYWIGAVAGLYGLTRQSDPRPAARAAAHFSATAVWLVPLILPAGALLIWGLLPDLAALRTPYGGFLALKALGFCGLILLAATNRLRTLPSLVAGSSGAERRFRRVLAAEYAILAGVLAATATMTSLFSWES
jgi:putative copper resistance protein D